MRFAAKRDRPDLLERLGVAHLAHTRPRQLSGGERQRVALARALAREPRVLLLDEPFGALDTITRRQVRDELADILSELGLPALLVTHAFEDAAVLAERIGVIDRGRLVQLGVSSELFAAPASVLVAALTGANIVEGTAIATDTGSTVHLSGGGALTTATPAHGPVQIAIQPWELELADPSTSSLTDRVLSVRQDRGGVSIRLTRFTITTSSIASGWPVAEGTLVGVRAVPHDVRVFRSVGSIP